MSICFYRPMEIAAIKLKFTNVNKIENQASLRQAPKQANVTETYYIYEIDNEKLGPKLAIAEDIMSICILNTTLSNNRTCKARYL
ncbi:MAG: hypothetical protein EZS28_027858 [Streblomastix strix]|uniref:Uncharacterized protein n=1 Tax=Streblomastix strix TaxID=222440 RepID=A0A5J4V2C7_9EUKA|nr:MAG: hypothetical protein EZS28_027858 [Streblomastix strix]